MFGHKGWIRGAIALSLLVTLTLVGAGCTSTAGSGGSAVTAAEAGAGLLGAVGCTYMANDAKLTPADMQKFTAGIAAADLLLNGANATDTATLTQQIAAAFPGSYAKYGIIIANQLITYIGTNQTLDKTSEGYKIASNFLGSCKSALPGSNVSLRRPA